MNKKESQDQQSLIPQHGGYRNLKSFQLAQLVYDVTVRFCDRYIEKRSRTRDQMVQAARSGVQNIAEGSQTSGTSKKTELKLTNVARASLEELRLDYEDFLRQWGLEIWAADDWRRTALVGRRCRTADEVARWVNEIALGKRGDGPDGHDGHNGRYGQNGPLGPIALPAPPGRPAPPGPPRPPASLPPSPESISSISSISSIGSMYPALSANAALVLIGVAMTLLDRQIKAQAAAFEKEGGFTERLYRIRSDRRRLE